MTSIPNMHHIAPPGQTTTPRNIPPMRRLCGLAMAALGLSASLASADPTTIPVANPSLETTFAASDWVPLTGWTAGQTPIAGNFSSAPDAGTEYCTYQWNDAGVVQNLNTNVSAGDTLSVTFDLGVSSSTWGEAKGEAFFKVGSTYYTLPYNITGQTPGRWTPAATDPNMPTSTGATLAALENTATALAAGDFGYADLNSSPLAAVQITAVPTLGVLTLSGLPVANNDIITAVDLGNLSYLSPLHGYGAPYEAIGIKVRNSVSPTGLWSLPATMTVNVTHVNHAPTSTGGAVLMRENTVKTFTTTDFQFSDTDAGDSLGAIKVTSLPNPLNGTLKLSGAPITLDQVVSVTDIAAANLTYTPSTGYTGSDSFKFQVRDASLFSADATMAITVKSDIVVLTASNPTSSITDYLANTTGSGTLIVTTDPPYIAWAKTFLPANDVSNPAGDNDHDGLTNQQEFAFGLSPMSGSAVNPPTVQLDKTTDTFSYQRRAATGLTYEILTSQDLVSWSEDTTARQVAGVVTDCNQTVFVTLTGTKPLAATKLFVRVAAQ